MDIGWYISPSLWFKCHHRKVSFSLQKAIMIIQNNIFRSQLSCHCNFQNDMWILFISCDQQETFIWDMEYCTLPSCDEQAEIIHLKDGKIVSKLKCIVYASALIQLSPFSKWIYNFFDGPASIKHGSQICNNFIIAELTRSYNLTGIRYWKRFFWKFEYADWFWGIIEILLGF